MRLQIAHSTTYGFEQPTRGLVQSLRLTPSVFDGQKVIDWKVAVHGAEIGASFRDGAGDWLQTATAAGVVSEITVSVEGIVETVDLAGMLRNHREQVPPLAYMRSTRATRVDMGLRRLAEEALQGASGTGLERAHALSEAVSQAIAYRPGETHAHTTAAEALSLGLGVCQDHAHALIAVARVAQLPARYVVGYLHSTEDGQAHEASHAWAEIHVGDLGWVGFDAANSCCPDERYVRIGSGYDAVDAAPIRGITRGGSDETLKVAVAVQQVAQ